MEPIGKSLPEVSMEMSTIIVVKNRCQFCYAFFKDPKKIEQHSRQCDFCFSESFETFDRKVKFACSVCFDVFETRADQHKHKELHKFPGGFPCLGCDEVFLNKLECMQHTDTVHGTSKEGGQFFASACSDCGAFFEQESYLRLHTEANCDRHRSSNWTQYSPDFLNKDAFTAHLENQHIAACEEDDAIEMPEPEVTLTESETVASVLDFNDPLQDDFKVENDVDKSQTILLDGICNPLPKRISTEFSNEESTVNAASSNVYVPRIGLGEKYKCKYCDRKFISRSCLDQHTVLHGLDGSLQIKCNHCTTYFRTTEDKSAHIANVHTDRIPCLLCKRSFSNARALLKHHNESCPKISEKGTEFDSLSALIDAQLVDKTTKQSIPREPVHEKRFACEYCGQKYFSELRLNRHIIEHGPNRDLLHKCDRCSSYYKTPEDRNAHRMAEHNEINLCEICDKTFQTPQSLRKHRNKFHKDRLREDDAVRKKKKKSEIAFKCKYCSRTYHQQKFLDIHVAEHGPDGSLLYRCELNCPMYFKTKKEMIAHERAEHKDKLACNTCGKVAQSLHGKYACARTHRHGHIRKQKKNFVCSKCGLSLSSMHYLNEHEKSDCGRLVIYKCDECGKSASTKYQLKRHILAHHIGEKRFACDFCEQRFIDKMGLLSHTRYRHTNERPHKCQFCEKRFVDKQGLSVHTTIHTGIKRYLCHGCGDRFPSNSALHKHRNARKDSCALVPIQPPLPKEES